MSLPPSWMTPEGIGEVQRARIERDWKHRERRTGSRALRSVAPPVDVNDADRFPNIASARQYLGEMKINDPERYEALNEEWGK